MRSPVAKRLGLPGRQPEAHHHRAHHPRHGFVIDRDADPVDVDHRADDRAAARDEAVRQRVPPGDHRPVEHLAREPEVDVIPGSDARQRSGLGQPVPLDAGGDSPSQILVLDQRRLGPRVDQRAVRGGGRQDGSRIAAPEDEQGPHHAAR
jgi:hypothetical protein